MIGKPETWTPDLVADRLFEAVEWARGSAGQVGPAPIRSAMPAFPATLDDHLREGWGLPEVAGDDEPDDRPLRVQEPAWRIARHERALMWAAEYLVPDHQGSARMLNLWIACKVMRRSFPRAARARGFSVAHAYRLKDRGLSLISQGLAARGEQP